MLARILAALLGWLSQLFLGARRDAVAHDDAMARGRAEAASETQAAISEVADAQAQAVDDGPDGGAALAAELRARAARLGGGLGARS